MSIRYCVRFTAKPGCGQAFVDELKNSGTWDTFAKDDGCISYEFFISAKDPDIVILMEEWESVEKEAAHGKLPHMQMLWDIKAKYITATEKHRCDFF